MRKFLGMGGKNKFTKKKEDPNATLKKTQTMRGTQKSFAMPGQLDADSSEEEEANKQDPKDFAKSVLNDIGVIK